MKIQKNKTQMVVREERELHFSKIKRSKGITLVALVITIILLLLLAGITISQLANSGIFEKAKQAKEISQESKNNEDITLADYNNKIENYLNGTRQNTKAGEELLSTLIEDGKEYELNDSVENYDRIEMEVGITMGENILFNSEIIHSKNIVTYE